MEVTEHSGDMDRMFGEHALHIWVTRFSMHTYCGPKKPFIF